MNITSEEYNQMAKEKSPKSKLFKDIIMAYIIGGLICVIGQGLLNLYTACGLTKADASAAVSITLVFLGTVLTGLKIYDNIAKIAGAGTLVPITGFANSIAAPALEFKSEGFVLGMSVKMFTIAGPVLVFGTSASIIYGLILWIFRLF